MFLAKIPTITRGASSLLSPEAELEPSGAGGEELTARRKRAQRRKDAPLLLRAVNAILQRLVR